VAGLRDLGYDQSRNLTLVYRSADGRADRLAPLAADLVALAPDIVVTLGATAAHAMARATSTIPVVFAPAGDAVATGLVQSLARPGGNVTGLSLNTWILNSKRLEVPKENSRPFDVSPSLGTQTIPPAWHSGRRVRRRVQL
jgi:putative ABC transport system substrate-binding protein